MLGSYTTTEHICAFPRRCKFPAVTVTAKMPTNIQLRKFDLKRIPDDAVCVFIGKRRTGKSFLLTDILYHKKHLPVGVVMSGTEDGNHHYKQFVPDLFVHGDFKVDVLNDVMNRQRRLVAKNASSAASRAFVLLDDCMYDARFMRETVIRQMLMNGRHWKLFIAITMQYCMSIGPDLRANVDYVFLLRENIRANREKLWKAFAGIFPTFAQFNQVMDAATENFECLVIDQTSKSNRIEDCVFWFKARERRGFKVGSPQLWKTHRKKYNTNGQVIHTEPQKRKQVVIKKV